MPAGTSQYLRFWYRYDTESPWAFWDQRWVQISVDGGPFMNVLQLWDDAPGIWLRSPAIALASYAGKTVQIRFHFATLDSVLNAYQGWNIGICALMMSRPWPGTPSGVPVITPKSLTYS